MIAATPVPIRIGAAPCLAIIGLVSGAQAGAAQVLNEDDVFALQLVGLVGAFWIIYVVPTVIAFYRKHPNRWAILVVNVVFGATGFGWLGSLVWACSALHISPSGNNGGESGLNLFVNDPARPVREVGGERGDKGIAKSAVPSDDPIERLTQLLALREAGAIDDSEFATLKRRFLP